MVLHRIRTTCPLMFALVYLHRLGNVQEVDVPMVLDEILAWRARYQERAVQSGGQVDDMPPLCPPFWRGRMGLDKDEQIALFQRAA